MVHGSSIQEVRKRIATTHEYVLSSSHESSHVIYALLHFMKVDSVSVFEDKEINRIHGETYYFHPMELNTIQDSQLLNILLRAEIGMSYAGLIGEKTLFKSISGSQKTPMFISGGAYEDNKAARKIIAKYNLASSGKPRANFKKKIMREVHNELNNYWGDVMIISHALFQDHKLLFIDLLNLLTKKSDNKDFWKVQFKTIEYIHDNNLSEDELKKLLTAFTN